MRFASDGTLSPPWDGLSLPQKLLGSTSSEAMIYAAVVHLMIRRLVHQAQTSGPWLDFTDMLLSRSGPASGNLPTVSLHAPAASASQIAAHSPDNLLKIITPGDQLAAHSVQLSHRRTGAELRLSVVPGHSPSRVALHQCQCSLHSKSCFSGTLTITRQRGWRGPLAGPRVSNLT